MISDITFTKDPPFEQLIKALNKQPLFVDEAHTKVRICQANEFMYMHTLKKPEHIEFKRIDAFKHHVTRNYIYLVNKEKLVVRYDANFNRGYFGEMEEDPNEPVKLFDLEVSE